MMVQIGHLDYTELSGAKQLLGCWLRYVSAVILGPLIIVVVMYLQVGDGLENTARP
jgi:hypothetical protein